MLERLGALLQGKKTYIVVALTFIGAGLQAVGVDIPIWVWTVLGAAGLGAVRSGINKKK